MKLPARFVRWQRRSELRVRRSAMKLWAIGLMFAADFMGPMAGASAQSGSDAVQDHVALAKAAAGQDHVELFNSLCSEPTPPAAAQSGPGAQASPDRSLWHVEPVKVFDDLYFVGQSEYSAWAVTTSDGIILVDTIWSYSVEDEIVGGLKKLGLDPKSIKYALVSHGHIDHAGGAKYLQDHFGTRIILTAADWDLLDHDTGPWPKPERDMVATD